MGLELDVEVGVLGVRDLEGGWVGRVVQQVLGDVAPVQRQPHLRACAATCYAHAHAAGIPLQMGYAMQCAICSQPHDTSRHYTCC